ncbi:MAG: peptide chain release factor N(5)-glutamine methyltransferase [Pseudomonadota bacterium]
MTSTPPERWLRAQPEHLQHDCRTLLLERFGWRLADWVRARNTPLTTERFADLDRDVSRLAAGEPLAYVLGTVSFRGLELAVNPSVLIPRPETEELIDVARTFLAARVPSADSAPRIADLGTGSGAIAIALASEYPQPAEIWATDQSPAALAVAEANAARHGVALRFSEGDWFDALRGRFDLLLSNPPYLAADDAHLPTLAAEPVDALVSGATGLEDLEALIAVARDHLLPRGALILEHGYHQGPAVRRLFQRNTYAQVETITDSYGHERFSRGIAS